MSDTTSAEPSTALAPVEARTLQALNSAKTEADLLLLIAKHQSITVVKDRAGREQAHGAAMELKRARTTIERVGKEARDDATKFSKAVIAEEKRLVAIIESEEERLFAVRDAWDAEQERIRQEAVAAEQRRVDEIRAKIALIEVAPAEIAGRPVGAIETELLFWKTQELSEADYQEFLPAAEHALANTIASVSRLFDAAKAQAAEQARLIAEREAIAAERQRQEARAAELAAQAEAIRVQQAEQAAELARQQAELAAERLAAEAHAAAEAQRIADEASARARQEAAERTEFLRQQQDAFEAERATAEAALQDERDRLAADRAEIQKQIDAAKPKPEPAPCPAPDQNSCDNKAQCFEPCGDLGNSAEHVVVSDQVLLIDVVKADGATAETDAFDAEQQRIAEEIIKAVRNHMVVDRDQAIKYIFAAAKTLQVSAA